MKLFHNIGSILLLSLWLLYSFIPMKSGMNDAENDTYNIDCENDEHKNTQELPQLKLTPTVQTLLNLGVIHLVLQKNLFLELINIQITTTLNQQFIVSQSQIIKILFRKIISKNAP